MLLDILQIQILVGVLITSTISGFLGMGGGMILMAFYSHLLPVGDAMVLHGLTQFFSNGFRAHLHQKSIQWRVIPFYLVGVFLITVILKQIEFVPSKALIFLALGIFPFLAFLPKISHHFSMIKPFRPFLCGILVTMAQLTAGASGGVLDIFFLNAPLTRYQIIATKAFTQTLGHFVKLAYYLTLGSFLTEITTFSFLTFPLIILTAMLGTRLGKKILDHLDDRSFKNISRIIVLGIATSLFIKGIYEILP